MVLGSLYLHTRSALVRRLLASLVPGCLIMALAVANAIPDFHQDRLVGKRNLVVRLGRRRGVVLYLALAAAGLAVVPAGVVARAFPARMPRWRSLAVPLLVASGRLAAGHVRAAAPFRRRRSAASSRCYVVGRRALRRRASSSVARHERRAANRIDALTAPLFVSWQLTRDCDLCCLHCCTESAPGKRLPDELDADEAMRVVDEIVRNDVPYVMLCGGEPLVVPHFLAVAEALGNAGVQLKIETNGQRLDADGRRAPRPAADPLDPDQPRRRYRGDLRTPAAGRLARPGARGLPRGARGWAAARSHVRAHARQHRRAAGGDRARAVARRVPLQHRQADARRHRGAALEHARADARTNTGEFRETLDRARGG